MRYASAGICFCIHIYKQQEDHPGSFCRKSELQRLMLRPMLLLFVQYAKSSWIRTGTTMGY